MRNDRIESMELEGGCWLISSLARVYCCADILLLSEPGIDSSTLFLLGLPTA